MDESIWRAIKLKVLTFSSLWPNKIQPLHGLFVRERIKMLAELCELRVVAPVPWFPPFHILGKRYYQYSQVPLYEKQANLDVYHPRHLIIPKILKSIDGYLMFISLRPFFYKIRQKFAFDIIDAHWAYPDGYAAGLLAREFGVPYTVTVRGDDITVFAQELGRGRMIRKALDHAEKVFAVCAKLRHQVINLGISPKKVGVTENGVDCSRFHAIPKLEARKYLRLPSDTKIILSVGHLCERKGFHLIVQAFNCFFKRKLDNGNLVLVIVGGDAEEGTFKHILVKEIARYGLQKAIHLVGAKNPEELPYWYSSADFFCLASSREGWPNVILESLACGTPVVATTVGGIPEIICTDRIGILVERTTESIGRGITVALNKEWDREYIEEYAKQYSWKLTANKIYNFFKTIQI